MFDINAARNEGYSDDEIQSFLNKKIDVQSAISEGYSLDEISNFVGQQSEQKAEVVPVQQTISEDPVIAAAQREIKPIKQSDPLLQPWEMPTVFTPEGIEEKAAEPIEAIKYKISNQSNTFKKAEILSRAHPAQAEDIIKEMPITEQADIKSKMLKIKQASPKLGEAVRTLGAATKIGAEIIFPVKDPYTSDEIAGAGFVTIKGDREVPKSADEMKKIVDKYRDKDGKLPLFPNVKDSGYDPQKLSTYIQSVKRWEENPERQQRIKEVGKKLIVDANEILDPFDYKTHKIAQRINLLKNEKSPYWAALERGDLGFVIDQAIADAAQTGDNETVQNFVDLKEKFEKDANRSPEERKGFLKNTYISLLEMLVPMGKTAPKMAVPGVGALWAGYEWGRQGMGEVTGELVKAGVPLEDAAKIGAFTGILYAAVEQLQVKQITNIPKAGIKKGVKTYALKMLKEKGQDWIQEVGEEGLQKLITDLGTEYGKQKAGKSDKKLGEVLKNAAGNVITEMKHASMPMAVLSLAGLGAGGISQAVESVEASPIVAEDMTTTVTEEPVVPTVETQEQIQKETDILPSIEENIIAKEKPVAVENKLIEKEILTPEELSEIETGIITPEKSLSTNVIEPIQEKPIEKRKTKRRTLEDVVEKELDAWKEQGIIQESEMYDPRIRKMAEVAADKTARNEVTGLPSKAHKHSAIDRIFKEKAEDEEVVIISMDQDYFKGFNDTYDHATGDDVLVQSMIPVNMLFESIGLEHFHESGDENSAVGKIKKSEYGEFVKNLEKVKSAMENVEIILPDGKSVPMSMTLALSNNPSKSDILLSNVKETLGRNSLGIDEELQKEYNIRERQGPDVKQKYLDAGLTGRGLKSEKKQKISKLQSEVSVQRGREPQLDRPAEKGLPKSSKQGRVGKEVSKASTQVAKPTKKTAGKPVKTLKTTQKISQAIREEAELTKKADAKAELEKKQVSFDFGESKKKTTFKEKIPENIKKQISPEIWEKTDIEINFPEGEMFSFKKGERGSIEQTKDGRFKVVLNPKLNADEIAEVLFHELGGHAGAANVLKTNKKLHKRISSIYKTQQNKDLVKQIRNAYKGESEDVIFSEWIAKSVEDHLANPKKSGFAYQVWKTIKEFFINLGIPIDSVDDAINSLVKATKKVEKVEAGLIVKPMKSKEFKEWFGDSKVVDEDGKPLVVYHGTDADIEVFDTIEGNYYFTPNPKIAFAYGKNVIPVYLSMTNPKIIDYEGEGDEKLYNDIKKAKEDGHDGIIGENVFDGVDIDNQYVAFEPTQIKSATGNLGTFDPKNPSILKSKELTKEEADLDHVKKLNKETRLLQAKIRFISPELAAERANMALKIRELKDESADMVRNMVYDYAKKIHLKGEPYNRVDTLIKNSKTARNYEKAVEIMDEVLQKREKNVLHRKVRDTIKKEKDRLKRLAGKGKSNQDITANKRLQEYIHDLEDISSRKLEKLKKTVEYFQNNPDKEVPDSIKKDVLLAIKTNIRDMDSRQLVRILQDINHIKKQGKLKNELKKAQRDRYIKKTAGGTAQKIRQTTKKTEKSLLEQAAKNKKGKFVGLSRLAKKYGWSHIRPERILDWFTDFDESGLQIQVFDKAVGAEETQLKNSEKTFKVFKNINKDVNMAETTRKPYMKVTDEKGNDIPLTLDQMMFIYANAQNPGNRAHLQGTGIDDGMIGVVTKNLPDKYKKVVDKTIDYYDTVQYERMNEIFQREHNIDMPKEYRYFPIMNLKTDRAETTIMNDLIARFSAKQGAVQKGMTKSRVKSKSPYRDLSFYSTVVNNLQQSEHYIAYNDAIRDINEFLNNKELAMAMDTKSEEATSQIKEWVKAIAYGKVRGSDQAIDKVSDWMRTNYMTSVLGLNLVTIMKQPASFAQGLKNVSKPGAVVSAAKFIQNPFKMIKFVNDKSVMMRNRATSYERELAEIAEKDLVKKQLNAQTAFGKAKEFSMKGITAADQATTTVLWYTKYNEIINKTGNESVAVKAADRVIRRTQPMGGIVHLPQIYRGGGLARAYTMFTNQLNQNLNLMFELQQTWGKKKASEKVAEIAFYSIIPSMLIYMASHGGRLPTEDPEGWGRAFVNNLTGGLMLVNKLIDSALLYVSGKTKEARGGFGDTKGSISYAVNFAPTSFNALEDIGMGIGYGKPENAIDAIMKLSGIPYTSIRRAWKGVKLAVEKKDPRYLIWSKTALKNPSIKDQMIRKLNKEGMSFTEKQKVYEYLTNISQKDLDKLYEEVPDLRKKIKKMNKSLFKMDKKQYENKFENKSKEAEKFEKWKLNVGRIK